MAKDLKKLDAEFEAFNSNVGHIIEFSLLKEDLLAVSPVKLREFNPDLKTQKAFYLRVTQSPHAS